MGEMSCEIWHFITNLNLIIILFWRIVSPGFQGFQGPFRVMSITGIQPKVLIMVIDFMILTHGLHMATECNNHRMPKIREDLSPCTTATSSDNAWRDCFDTVFLWNYWKCHRYKKVELLLSHMYFRNRHFAPTTCRHWIYVNSHDVCSRSISRPRGWDSLNSRLLHDLTI